MKIKLKQKPSEVYSILTITSLALACEMSNFVLNTNSAVY